MKYIKTYEGVNVTDYENNQLLLNAHKVINSIINWTSKKYQWAEDYYNEQDLNIRYLFWIHINGNDLVYSFFGNQLEVTTNLLNYLYTGGQHLFQSYWDNYNDDNIPIDNIHMVISIGSSSQLRYDHDLKIEYNQKKDIDRFNNMDRVKNDFDKHKEIIDRLGKLKSDSRVIECNYSYPNFDIKYDITMDFNEISANVMRKINK
jgi:hypothetical protein